MQVLFLTQSGYNHTKETLDALVKKIEAKSQLPVILLPAGLYTEIKEV